MLAAGLWAITLPVIFVFAIFLIEVIAGLLSRPVAKNPSSGVKTVVVVPAHNEAEGIAASLASIAADLPENAHILVVADNCTDGTADVARNAGAEVIERHDGERRGKGYALSFARDHLAAAPPGVVAIIDADCRPAPGSIAALRDAVAAWQVPVQGRSVVEADGAPSPMVQISNFAYLIKTYVRQRGAGAVGRVALLGGTGMALPWMIFEAAPLASGDLVEDLSLGVFAVKRGQPPRFLETARVTSHAAAQSNTLTQRTRWEHGFIASMGKYALPLLGDGLRGARWSQIWLGLHLLVPPLALLAVIGTVILVAVGALGWFAGVMAPALTLLATMAVAAVAILIAWALHGRAVLSSGALLRLPLYVLWKLPIYLRLVRKPEAAWVRTDRGQD